MERGAYACSAAIRAACIAREESTTKLTNSSVSVNKKHDLQLRDTPPRCAHVRRRHVVFREISYIGLDKPLPIGIILNEMNSKQKKELSKRIKYVTGQLAAINKMIAEGKDSSDIFVQLRSVESAFRKSIVSTFETEHRLELAERIVEELESCPGSCQYCDLVDTLKRDFPKLTLTQVLDGLHQMKKRRK
ncbi:MAG: metal-sensing transcriptional repressor [Bacteroidota bacterium]|nr:metal-sensing transcriptional repressor [Bacteroidota bacterium]